MISLSIFCSSDSVSLALFNKEKEIFFLSQKSKSKNKSELLIPLIQKLFENFDYRNLSYIYFSRGPGSFTSIRTLVSIAQGIRLSSKAKILTTTIFKVFLNEILKKKKPVLFLYRDSRKDFYFQFYDCVDSEFMNVSRILSGDVSKIKEKARKFQHAKKITELYVFSNEEHKDIIDIPRIKFQKLSIDARNIFRACYNGFSSKRMNIIYHHPHYGKRISN